MSSALRGLPGVVVPRMATLPRQVLASSEAAAAVASAGFSFPFLCARPAFTPAFFSSASTICTTCSAAAAEFPGDDLCLIEQLDARDSDGFFRKCRVMIIDRKIYPLHLAISRNWKVHYFRADMAQSSENRAKDEAFLTDIASFVGARGMAALRAHQRSARSRLLRHRFCGERRRRHSVLRGQRHHGHGAAF